MNGSSTLSSLLRHTSIQDHEQILVDANKSLALSATDVVAQHVKAVALIKLDRFDDALHCFEQGSNELRAEASLAWAYTLYKTGRLPEAQKVLSQISPSERGLYHLQAQVAYRREDFQLAAEIYERLVDQQQSSNDEPSDLRVNTGAVDAQLLWKGLASLSENIKPSNTDFQQFETAFNIACAYIARGHLKQAEILLNRARDICSTTDDLSDQEKKVELIPITVQQLYVLSMLNKSDELEKLRHEIDPLRVTDKASRHLAQVNILTTSTTLQNPFMYERAVSRLKPTLDIDLPFNFQASALRRNQRTLTFLKGKCGELAREISAEALQSEKTAINSEVVIQGILNAAIECRGKSGKAALKRVIATSKLHTNDVGKLITAVQLCLSAKDVDTAIALLESLFARLELNSTSEDLGVRFAPGLVAVLVALYSKTNRTAQGKAELAKAAAYWRKRPVKESESLLKSAATVLLRDPSPSDVATAHELFQILNNFRQSNVVHAGLAASQNGSMGKDEGPARLPGLHTFTSVLDASALELAGIPRMPIHTSQSRKRVALEETAQKPKFKKARSARLPKTYQASAQPDPERWLPLRDRSNYKPKGKRKLKVIGAMATQGGMTSEDSRPTTPVASQVVQQAKARKKKGKGAK